VACKKGVLSTGAILSSQGRTEVLNYPPGRIGRWAAKIMRSSIRTQLIWKSSLDCTLLTK